MSSTSSAADPIYDTVPTVLIAAGVPDLLAAECRAAGWRVAGHCRLEEFGTTGDLAATDLILLDLTGEGDRGLEAALEAAADLGSDRDVLVQFAESSWSTVAERLGGTDTTLISAAAPGALTAALTLSRHQVGQSVNEAKGGDALRLQLLADQVARIARTLAEMTDGNAALGSRGGLRSPVRESDATPRPITSASPVTAKAVRALIAERRLRDQFLDPDLFGEPAWDMLLDLYAARLEHTRVSVTSLCIAAAVPSTTALRWLQTLTKSGLVERRADPHDKRRVYIALSDATSAAIDRYFAELAKD